MATADDFRQIALSLAGTTEAPHFDRSAFKVDRIYATLAADQATANVRFTPDEQEFKCLLAPEAFAPIPNAWGKRGWTIVKLAELSVADLKNALEMAWGDAHSKTTARRKGSARSK